LSVQAAAVLAVLMIAGCGRSIRSVSSPIAMPEQFSADGDQPLPDPWWESFGDPQLNQLMEEGLGQNFTIRSAWDRLAQAEQIAVEAGANLFPEVNYEGGASRTRLDVSDQVTYTTAYSAGLIASYEVDLWGRVRSSQQAAVLDAQAAQEDVSAAAVTLSANIARTWYRLAEAKLQETLIGKQVDTNRQVLEIIAMQFRQGLTGAADVFRQRQLVESGQGLLIAAQENIALLQHELSVLLGRSPGPWWAEQSIDLIDLPPLPQAGLPAETLQRRPDITAAYQTVQAADRRVAAAIADQYPRISLAATAETFGEQSNDLFRDWAGNLAANAAGPLFDGGLRKAEVRRRRAVLSQSINDYAQALLDALKETEDALQQEMYQSETINNLQSQLALSRQVSDTTRQNYLKGKLDYLRVLEALVSRQTLERNELAARRVLIERRIDLCRSIAGPWEMQRPPQARIQETDRL
jgi:NodT family efflux transporter outer membrane factor (OMF) lipoprotein